MKALNIFGLIIAICLLIYCADIIRDVQNLFAEINSRAYWYRSRSSFNIGLQNIALDGAFIMLLITIFYLVYYGVNLKHVKRITVKVFGIIGVVLASIFFIYNIVIIGINGDLNFGVVYFSWIIFAVITLIFTIVLLVQTMRDIRGPKKMQDQDDILYHVEADFEVE